MHKHALVGLSASECCENGASRNTRKWELSFIYANEFAVEKFKSLLPIYRLYEELNEFFVRFLAFQNHSLC